MPDVFSLSKRGTAPAGVRLSKRVLSFVALAIAISPATVHAATYTWISTTTGTWNGAANWSPNGIPGATDTVVSQSSGANGSLSIRSDFTIASATDSSSSTWTWNPSATGTYTVTIGSLTDAAKGQLTIRNNAGDLLNYAGNTVYVTNGGVLSLGLGPTNYINSINIANSTTVDAGATLQFALVGGGTASFGALTSSGTFGIYLITGQEQNTIQVTSLAGSGVVGTGTKSTGAFTGTATLTIAPGAATSSTFSGLITNYSAIPLNIVLSGSGTQVLTGSNNYTGSTAITAGTLVLSGSGSISNSPVISVSGPGTLDVSTVSGGTYAIASGQTLGGNGVVKAATLNIVGNLAPGLGSAATGQNLSVNGGLTLSGTTLLSIYSDATNDSIAVSGGLLTYGGYLALTLNYGQGSYNLFTLTGGAGLAAADFTGVSVNGVSLADLAGDWSSGNGAYNFQETSGILVVSAVPEPSAWALLFTGILMILAFGGRRPGGACRHRSIMGGNSIKIQIHD